MSTPPDYFDANSKLVKMWNQPLSASAALPATTFTPEEAERSSIYSLLLMAIVRFNWNGNKNGARDGEYPWRPKQLRSDGTYEGDPLGDRYLGHNIAAIAVDASGRVVDFDFNHNKVFNSSVQHAEARLIRRLFGLAAVQDSWDLTSGPRKYRTDLKETTVYTSLESCAQCSGIMALGNLPRVVYLQPDPGQYMIGQILRNLSDPAVAEHVPASAFGFPYFDQLIQAHKDFQSGVAAGTLFWMQGKLGPGVEKGAAMTSFLCNDAARDIYENATQDFAHFACKFPSYAPVNTSNGSTALSNAQALAHAQEFFEYAAAAAQRGTPHFN